MNCKLSENYKLNGCVLDADNNVVCEVNTLIHKDKGQLIVDSLNASTNELTPAQLIDKNNELLQTLKDTREFIKQHNKRLNFGAYDVIMYRLNKAIRESNKPTCFDYP